MLVVLYIQEPSRHSGFRVNEVVFGIGEIVSAQFEGLGSRSRLQVILDKK